MSEKRRSGLMMILATVLLIAIFASALICSLASIGVEGGEVKISGSSPEGLVSAGAPRSQLALKQMFDSMGAVRTNGNRVVYEPITEEYLLAVSERIKKGEKPVLSVEEILYIISDSVDCAKKYDGVKLNGEGNVTFKKDNGDRPAHVISLENGRAIYQIIVYRVKSLCHEGAFEYDGNTMLYYPDEPDSGSRERRFVFTPLSDENRNENIVFYPGNGQRVTLYPLSDSEKYDLKYMLQTDEALTEAVQNILIVNGYNPDRCRNVTPLYWAEITECKLVISGGRIIVVDPECGCVADSAPTGMRTVSIAAGDEDGDGKYELYFTACSEDGGVAVRYVPGNSEIELLFERDFFIGVYEDIDGKGISFYRVEQIESGSHLNLLRRIGSAIGDQN